MGKIIEDKDKMRSDLGQYPTYLYDDNIFNDVQYVFNRDVIFSRVYPMTKANDETGFVPGITSFDKYSNWMRNYKFGKNTLFPKGVKAKKPGNPVHLSDEEANAVRGQIEQNVTAIAKEYPDVTFYYFITPYSAQWWMDQLSNGKIYRQVEAERILIEEMLKHPNVKLFSFNCRFDLTTDLNNYKDSMHYAEWINSLMLHYMYNDRYLLTKDNYNSYLEEELQFYISYDYTQINEQPDYDDDYYAALLLAEETYGLIGKEINLSDSNLELQNSELVENQFEGKIGILCTGRLQRDYHNKEITTADYMRDTAFIGFKMIVEDITPNKFITFCGKKITDHGQPTVYIYDSDGNVVSQCTDSYRDIKGEWKQYVINVTELTGKVSIIFNGGYIDDTGSPESEYVFSNLKIY